MYLERVLAADEQILETGKLHWVNYVKPFVLWLVGLCCFANNIFVHWGVVCLIIAALLYLNCLATEMCITNRRVMIKTGIISLYVKELKNTKIETVRLQQSVLGRILGYGSLVFTGTGISRVVFKGIENHVALKDAYTNLVENA